MAEVEVQAAQQNGGDEEAPVKRGRGRPPKAAKAGGDASSGKKGRGRPPKSGGAVESPRKAMTGGRGRPSKRPASEDSGDEQDNDDDAEEKTVAKRGRGRPPKKGATKDKPVKGRGRGRPKKNAAPAEEESSEGKSDKDEESDE